MVKIHSLLTLRGLLQNTDPRSLKATMQVNGCHNLNPLHSQGRRKQEKVGGAGGIPQENFEKGTLRLHLRAILCFCWH